tara:strand:- start:98 stop:211 length:114 start_codon:yes stop_codon:yes gene_type:complete
MTNISKNQNNIEIYPKELLLKKSGNFKKNIIKHNSEK